MKIKITIGGMPILIPFLGGFFFIFSYINPSDWNFSDHIQLSQAEDSPSLHVFSGNGRKPEKVGVL